MPDLNRGPASRSGRARPARRRVTIGRFRRRQDASVSAVVAAALLAAACSSGYQPDSPATQITATTASVPAPPATSASPSSTTSMPPATTAPPRTAPPVRKIAVPALAGMTVGEARTSLARRHLRWRITNRRTTRYPPDTVASQSPPPGTPVLPATVIALVIAQAPPPPPPPVPPAPACNPAYPDVCLKDGIGDYDCASGSGNGPNYVDGPITVRPPDPFDLDRDGDGIGCENG
jgi:PASTA domain